MYRKLLSAIVLTLAVAMVPAYTIAKEMKTMDFTGTLTGLNCATRGELCPADKGDPHIAAETNFVLMVDGGMYYLITNVNANVLARHALEKVMINGEKNEKYNSIKAMSLSTMKNGKWVEVWSLKAELKELQELMQGS